jgi:hypothetical protein
VGKTSCHLEDREGLGGGGVTFIRILGTGCGGVKCMGLGVVAGFGISDVGT